MEFEKPASTSTTTRTLEPDRTESEEPTSGEFDKPAPTSTKTQTEPDRNGELGEISPDTQVKETETVVFLPATPGSLLKSTLQEHDNNICLATNCPQVRFIERAGVTIMEELGRNNPWAQEWTCLRKDCLP